MNSVIDDSPQQGFAQSGRVEYCEGAEAKVRLDRSGLLQLARVPLSLDIREGDEVLLVGDPAGEQFVTQLLGRQAERLALEGGARAEVSRDRPERLCVYSPGGELLLEFDSVSGRARVHSGAGGLEVESAGDLQLRAAGNLSLEADRIDARARHAARIECGSPAERAGLALSHRGARLFGALIELLGHQTELRSTHLRQSAEEIETQADTLRQLAGQLETTAETLTETARRSFRSAEELAQQTAGRLRMLVSGTYHFRSRKASMKAQRDFKIDADQIHLG